MSRLRKWLAGRNGCYDIGPLRLVWHSGPNEGWIYWRPARFSFWRKGPMWEMTVGRMELRWRVHRWYPRNNDAVPAWILADEIRRPIRGRGDMLWEASVKALREHRHGPGLGTGYG